MNGTDAREPPAVALTKVNHWLSLLEDNLNLIAALAIFFLMFVGVVQILGRSIFGVAIYGYIDYMEQASVIFAFFGIAYCQRLGSHVRMDLILRGFSMRGLWAMEAVAASVALVVVTLLVYSSFLNFMRAYNLGDSTMDIKLPIWPSKLVVPCMLSVLWLRLVVQIWDYLRLARWPNAKPIAVPVIETAEEQARNEIEDALGREGLDDAERK
jgi:TRAP-type C4-dicarboxylate transport system permease small subunit